MRNFNEFEFFRMMEEQNRLLHLLSVHRIGSDGNTVLHKAAYFGRLRLVSQLIDWGTILDQKNTAGETALTYSLLARQTQVSRLLIQHGADVNVRPVGRKQGGATPLQAAMANEDAAMVALIVDAGCSISQEAFLDNVSVDEIKDYASKDEMAALVLRLHHYRTCRPSSLQQLCRKAIRSQMRKSAKGRDIWGRIETLECPKILKEYLTFRTPSDFGCGGRHDCDDNRPINAGVGGDGIVPAAAAAESERGVNQAQNAIALVVDVDEDPSNSVDAGVIASASADASASAPTAASDSTEADVDEVFSTDSLAPIFDSCLEAVVEDVVSDFNDQNKHTNDQVNSSHVSHVSSLFEEAPSIPFVATNESVDSARDSASLEAAIGAAVDAAPLLNDAASENENDALQIAVNEDNVDANSSVVSADVVVDDRSGQGVNRVSPSRHRRYSRRRNASPIDVAIVT